MFTAWIQDSMNNTVKEYDDCIGISVVAFAEMATLYSDILNAIGLESNYVKVVDSTGAHFYPFTNADDIEKRMSDIRSAFNNMKNDKDFKNKNVRLVIELAYD